MIIYQPFENGRSSYSSLTVQTQMSAPLGYRLLTPLCTSTEKTGSGRSGVKQAPHCGGAEWGEERNLAALGRSAVFLSLKLQFLSLSPQMKLIRVGEYFFTLALVTFGVR